MVLEKIKAEIRKQHLSGWKKLLFIMALIEILTPLEWVIAPSLANILHISVVKVILYIKIISWIIIIWLAPKLIKKYIKKVI